MTSSTNELVSLTNLDKAILFIQKASAAQLTEIIHQAEAVRVYAAQTKKGMALSNQATEIKFRAERKLSKWLDSQPKHKGGKPVVGQSPVTSTLKNLGFSKEQAYKLRKISSLSEPDFEKEIEQSKNNKTELTRSEVLRRIKESDKTKRRLDEKCNSIVDIDIRIGDFKKVLADVKNIDSIITDPPYPKEFIQCYSDLSKYASEHLKEKGFLAAYSGQYNLPEVINRLSEHLTYVWTFCLYHVGKKQLVNGVNIMCGWKPVLIFSKGCKKMRFSAYDVLISEAREKESHRWQQSASGVKGLIEILSKPNDVIVDPFAGSGTFLKVANDMGRKAIGAEING